MAINEDIVTGRKFRKLLDEATKLWQRISFWTKASDVEFDDGQTAETKMGAIKGITTDLNVTKTGYAADATMLAQLYSEISKTAGGISVRYNSASDYIQVYAYGEWKNALIAGINAPSVINMIDSTGKWKSNVSSVAIAKNTNGSITVSKPSGGTAYVVTSTGFIDLSPYKTIVLTGSWNFYNNGGTNSCTVRISLFDETGAELINLYAKTLTNGSISTIGDNINVNQDITSIRKKVQIRISVSQPNGWQSSVTLSSFSIKKA